jgi:hypothetical protein
MKKDRPGKPPKPPLKAPKGNKLLGVADFFKLVIGQRVRKRQQRGRQQWHMQNVLQGTVQHRQSGMQQLRRGNQVGLLSWLQA